MKSRAGRLVAARRHWADRSPEGPTDAILHLVKHLHKKRSSMECLTAYLTGTRAGFAAAWRLEPARNRDNILTTISAILENPPFGFAASKYKHGMAPVNSLAARLIAPMTG